MALATGVEAPSSAIAQLGQLDDRGRERFGRATLWLTFVLAATLTVSIVALAITLRIGEPRENSTLIADVARAAVGDGAWFALFQLTSSLLLLAAASSSFQAGPGLLKAMARRTGSDGRQLGILPPGLGATNRHHTLTGPLSCTSRSRSLSWLLPADVTKNCCSSTPSPCS